ncbi:hypothetical protein [Kitasatospora sp. NPDC093102]|uniref:hypothetical protein n=1 Tax=Kitasatospora sp. NPDC093102 TaxID=3155069 RepID=UPI0034465834
MPTHPAHGNDSRLSLWRRVREYAVPPSMIETSTARRLTGDWAGACAAPPRRTVVGLFPRPSRYDEGREDHRPDSPPEWARVVTIG